MSDKNLSGAMMEALRGRRGLDDDDTSQDDEIRTMSPAEIVRECAAWELGDPYWATIFAGWMQAAGCKVEDLVVTDGV
uniref:Uncharacterized protein n=1 Tax=viral metagenome TaxID=1070528 RepID=A0A6H1Z7P2_9ZZZZ